MLFVTVAATPFTETVVAVWSWIVPVTVTDVVFVALPEVGAAVAAGAGFAEIESTKSVSDIYAPVSGTVAAVNGALADRPEAINADPYGDGWICDLTIADRGELDGLLDAAAYRALIA